MVLVLMVVVFVVVAAMVVVEVVVGRSRSSSRSMTNDIVNQSDIEVAQSRQGRLQTSAVATGI